MQCGSLGVARLFSVLFEDATVAFVMQTGHEPMRQLKETERAFSR
jgi:hypothetical protein